MITSRSQQMVYDGYNRCKLFSLSFKEDARKRLDKLPTISLTRWKDIRSAFIKNFFDELRYWEVRNKISTFSQGSCEPFKNAWGRFRKYQLKCPHHGYSGPQLINTFYKGLNRDYQPTLDTASKWNFSTRSPEEDIRLIENVTLGKGFERLDG